MQIRAAQPKIRAAQPEIRAAQPEICAAQPEICAAQPEIREYSSSVKAYICLSQHFREIREIQTAYSLLSTNQISRYKILAQSPERRYFFVGRRVFLTEPRGYGLGGATFQVSGADFGSSDDAFPSSGADFGLSGADLRQATPFVLTSHRTHMPSDVEPTTELRGTK